MLVPFGFHSELKEPEHRSWHYFSLFSPLHDHQICHLVEGPRSLDQDCIERTIAFLVKYYYHHWVVVLMTDDASSTNSAAEIKEIQGRLDSGYCPWNGHML
jgi:hypothetical protein